MTPYYTDGAISIYHGDAVALIGALSGHDLVLTDPPYGIGSWSSTGGNSISAEEAADTNGWDALPSPELLRAAVAAGRYAVLWGGNYLSGVLGATRAPLVWDKKIRGMHYADGEMAWTNFDFGSLRICELAAGASDARGKRVHPTQKPVELMAWCIAVAEKKMPVASLIDPFMGSGTSLVAAKLRGIRAVGIEREEKYCEAAAKRLDDRSLPLFGALPGIERAEVQVELPGVEP